MPQYLIGVGRDRVDPSMAPEVEPFPPFADASAALAQYVDRQRRKSVLVEPLEPMTYHAPKHDPSGSYFTHGWWRVECRLSCVDARHSDGSLRPADVVYRLYYYSSLFSDESKYRWHRDPGAIARVEPLPAYRLKGPFSVPGTLGGHYWLYLDRTVPYEAPGRWVLAYYGKNLGVLTFDDPAAEWYFRAFASALRGDSHRSPTRDETAAAAAAAYAAVLHKRQPAYAPDAPSTGADRSPSDRARSAHFQLDDLAQSVSRFIDWTAISDAFPPRLAQSFSVAADAPWLPTLQKVASAARQLAHDASYLADVFDVLPPDSGVQNRLRAAVSSLALAPDEVAEALKAQDSRYSDVLRWKIMTRVLKSVGFESISTAKNAGVDVEALRSRCWELINEVRRSH